MHAWVQEGMHRMRAWQHVLQPGVGFQCTLLCFALEHSNSNLVRQSGPTFCWMDAGCWMWRKILHTRERGRLASAK